MGRKINIRFRIMVTHCALKAQTHMINPKKEYQDALQLWLNITPHDIPRMCQAKDCNSQLTPDYTDHCTKGGSVIRRHDYIKTIIGQYSEKAFGVSSTSIEPSLGNIDPEAKTRIRGNTDDNARADICIKDFTGIHSHTYLDICVISPVCQTNSNQGVTTVMKNTESRKNTKHK